MAKERIDGRDGQGGGNKAFAGDDLIILAAAPNGLTGSVNGVNFTSLSSFPEGGELGAIQASWTGLGISANNQQFGYANVGVMGSNPMTITADGVGQGTIFYAEMVNPETGTLQTDTTATSQRCK